MVLSYHSSPLLLTMQCWPLARGSFISERPQKQLSDYPVHKWWSSVITTLSALASLLGFLVFTATLPLCGGNVNYLKLRCDQVALLRRTCVIAYDKWQSLALKCHEGCELCLLSGKYVAMNVRTGMFSQSLPVIYSCHCQYAHVQSVITSTLQLSLSVRTCSASHCQYFTVVTVSMHMFSQSLPVLYSCHCQDGHVQPVIASTLQLSLSVFTCSTSHC